MYQASENFGDAIAGPNRKFNTRLLENGKVLVESVKSFTKTSGAEEITIGSAVASYIQATIENKGILLSGKEVNLEIGLEVDGEMEYIPMGLYTIQNPKIESNKVTFTAYDRLTSKCNGAYYSKLSYPTDALNILSEIESMTGIIIDKTGLSKGIQISQRAVVNEGYNDETEEDTVITTYVNPFDGYTYKETIGFIAGLFGKFAACGRTGKIEFRWYQDISYEIQSNIFYNDLQETEESFSIERLTCDNSDQTLSSGAGTTGISMQNPVMTQDNLDNVFSKVKGLTYTPAVLRFIGDMRLDTGDIVTAVKNDGTKFTIPIISSIVSFDGGLMQTIASYGNTVEEDNSDTKGPLTEMAERVQYELAFVKKLMVDNLTATNATIKNLSGDILDFKTGDFENLKSDVASFKTTTTENLNATNAKISNLEADTVKTKELEVEVGKFGYLKTDQAEITYATIKNLEATNGKIDNLSGDLANFKAGEFKDLKSDVGNFKTIMTENLEATNAKIVTLEADQATFEEATAKNFNATNARITNVEADYVKATELEAKVGTFGYVKTTELEAKVGAFGYLKASALESEVGKFGYLKVDDAKLTYATITNLNAANAEIDKLVATKATITDLNAAVGRVGVLESGYADLNTLVNGNLTSANIQNLTLTSKNTTIENGMIKNAMIENLSFDKITGIDINTTNLTVHSNDGKSKWSDNTIQISDANRVRVQIGKDASNDYSMSVWDKSGKLIWDALGATENTIQRKIIRDGVVADDANISGSKLDINSVIKEVNGSTTKLKSSTVAFDDRNQTLDVVFNTLETTVNNIEIGGRNLLVQKNISQGYLSTDGKGSLIGSGGGDQTSDWIDVSGSKYITITLYEDFSNTTNSGRYCEYDADKNCINTVTYNERQKGSVIVELKSNTKYVRVTAIECKTRKYKIEKGNKATDWTPAPEDTDEIISSHTTSIGVMQGQISTLISDSTTIKGNYDTLIDNYNSTVKTVNSMKTTIGEHTTKLNNQDQSIAAVSSRTTTIETNLSGLTTRVSATEAKYDNLEIGGRNLLRDADTMSTWIKGTKLAITYGQSDPDGGSKAIKIVNSEGTYGAAWIEPKERHTYFKAGQYTYSFYAKSDAASGSQIQTCITGNYTKVFDLTATWKRYTYTITIANDLNTVDMYWFNFVGKSAIYFYHPKLETGNKATDFTIAPEDTNQQIKAVETIASQTANKFEWLVKSGTSSTDFKLTDRTADLVAERINMNGLVTFNGLSSDAKNEIDKAAQNKVNSLDIGGRNLARDTSNEYTTPYTYFTGSANTCFYNKRVYLDGLKAGDTITIHMYVKYDDIVAVDGQTSELRLQGSGNVTLWTNGYLLSSWKSVSGSGVYELLYPKTLNENDVKNQYWECNIRTDDIQSGSIQVKKFKVEKGNKATDWTPAPEDVAQDASTKASAAETNAKTYAKNSVEWVTNNGQKTENLYYMVSNWANAAVSNTTQINGGWIMTDTITASKIAIGDFTNYCDMNAWNTYGFTREATVDGEWFSASNYGRDNYISEFHSCEPGQVFYVEYDISSTIKEGSEYKYAGIMLFGYDGTKTVKSYNRNAGVTATADGPITHISTKITMPSNTRFFRVVLQIEGYPTFTGTLKIRNISVRKAVTGKVIVDGSITASKIAAGTITADSAIIADAAITNAKIQSIDATKITTGQLSADRIDVNGIFAKDITATGTIRGVNLVGAKGTFTGEITAHSGGIANFKIEDGWIYNGITIGNEKSCGIGAGSAKGGRDDWIFWAGNGTFKVDINGALTATSGSIAGWTITDGKLYNGTSGGYAGIGKESVAWAFWAGASSPGDSENAPFRVGHNGSLKATNADITGTITAKNGKIGRYDITSTYLMTNSGSNASGIGGNQAFWAGNEDSNSAPFHVSYDGSVYCGSLTSESSALKLTLNSGYLTITAKSDGSTAFRVDEDGYTRCAICYAGNYFGRSMELTNNIAAGGNVSCNDLIAGGWIYNSSTGRYTWSGQWEAYINCQNANNSNNIYYNAGYHAFYVTADSSSGMMYIDGNGVKSRKGFTKSSDERIKKNFKSLGDDFIEEYMNLNPVRYQLKDDNSDKYHFGFKAQEVAKTLGHYGQKTGERYDVCVADTIDPKHAKEVFGEDNMDTIYGLRYDEIVPINTFMIQKTRKDLMYQAGRIDMQEAIINDLQTRLLQAEKTIKQLTQALA